jgi:hypothetical protein
MRLAIFVVLTVACTSKTPEANWSGSAWARCNDTAAGACDTASVEVEEEEPAPTADSCTIGAAGVCVEPNEPDNEAWCTGLPSAYDAEYSAGPCSTDGLTGTCAFPAGGDYTAAATGYFYTADGEAICTGAGGSYTAA